MVWQPVLQQPTIFQPVNTGAAVTLGWLPTQTDPPRSPPRAAWFEPWRGPINLPAPLAWLSAQTDPPRAPARAAWFDPYAAAPRSQASNAALFWLPAQTDPPRSPARAAWFDPEVGAPQFQASNAALPWLPAQTDPPRAAARAVWLDPLGYHPPIAYAAWRVVQTDPPRIVARPPWFGVEAQAVARSASPLPWLPLQADPPRTLPRGAASVLGPAFIAPTVGVSAFVSFATVETPDVFAGAIFQITAPAYGVIGVSLGSRFSGVIGLIP